MRSNITEFQKFLFNLTVFICVVFALDFSLGKCLRFFYFAQKSGIEYHTTYTLDSVSSEVVVLGSSRADHHFIPSIIEDSLHKSCFNAGRSGQGLFYHEAILQSLMLRYKPEYVILEISPVELYYDKMSYDGLSVLMPYYHQNQFIDKALNLKGKYEKLKYLSSIYPFNSLIHLGLKAFVGSEDNVTESKLAGYIPLKGVVKDSVLRKREKFEAKTFADIDINKVNSLKSIIYLCQKNDVKLLLIQSPRFHLVDVDASCEVFERIIRETHTEYVNLSGIPLFNRNPEWFRDLTHLNDKGARVFTTLVTRYLSNGK